MPPDFHNIPVESVFFQITAAIEKTARRVRLSVDSMPMRRGFYGSLLLKK